MSYEKGILYFKPPPVHLLLAGTKFRCKEFCKERGLNEETFRFVLNRGSFRGLDPKTCRITHAKNFHTNPFYRDREWQTFYREVMELGQPTDSWFARERNFVAHQKMKRAMARRKDESIRLDLG